ncbi:rhomboid family intramembrane serine protease [Heyndrickxia vini]|uniref:Rhomboid family intramembrane serine protease n=1 Tax=Heyndrickxia vini TaxID=1476025 RepID=A0ABX7E091_9BACI|nr:rhomboid family intramembrane serine protease [Heyndrickxia vini]QQZ09166.1 rhomboid family intramembrane serine protease [Heyndrickxia vini]
MFIRNEGFFQYIKSYPIISMIILLQVLLFIMNFIPFVPHKYIFQCLSGVNLYIADGQYWRLITPIFVHASFTHLLFNSFSLLIFGPFLERLVGKMMFCALYLICGVLGNIATFFLLPLTYSHVGASGAIFGLFGIYLAMFVLKKHVLTMSIKQVIIPIVVIALIMTFLEPNVNIISHIFGILSGYLIGIIYFTTRKKGIY